MGDPSGVSGAFLGAIVAKLLDEVIVEIKKVVYCKRDGERLLELLKKIQPLVLKAANVSTGAQGVVAGAVPTNASGTGVPGTFPIPYM